MKINKNRKTENVFVTAAAASQPRSAVDSFDNKINVFQIQFVVFWTGDQ